MKKELINILEEKLGPDWSRTVTPEALEFYECLFEIGYVTGHKVGWDAYTEYLNEKYPSK